MRDPKSASKIAGIFQGRQFTACGAIFSSEPEWSGDMEKIMVFDSPPRRSRDALMNTAAAVATAESSLPTGRQYRRREGAAFCTSQGFPVAPATLAKLATVGGGPTFRHFGRIPIYSEADLLAWIAAKLSAPKRSTSDQGRAA